MRILRRWLASGALGLTALQLALLFAVPASACCASASAAPTASAGALSDDAPDCCPPGAHPKGECPLHRRARSEAPGARIPNHCRFTCGHSSMPQFVIGAIGVLPAPPAIVVPLAESAAPVTSSVTPSLPSVIPDAPPPELL